VKLHKIVKFQRDTCNCKADGRFLEDN